MYVHLLCFILLMYATFEFDDLMHTTTTGFIYCYCEHFELGVN